MPVRTKVVSRPEGIYNPSSVFWVCPVGRARKTFEGR